MPRLLPGGGDGIFVIVQGWGVPDKVRVAVHKAGHYDMPRGIDFLGLVQARQVLHAPAETHFHNSPVLNQEGSIANNR